MSTVLDRCDVVVVGGGVVGCALARELAERGARVAVVERAEPGSEASGAAAGMLSPQAESTERTPFFDLCLASRALHRVWARELAGETGIEVGYRRCGVLRCFYAEQAPPSAEAFSWQRAEGLAVEPLNASSAAFRTEKCVSDAVRGALFFPEDGLVDGARLTHALAVSARSRGARIHVGETVRRCLLREGRCVGVETGSGALVAGQVVIAAGAWSGFDTGLPFSIPVEPVRGQIVELAADFELPTIVQDDRVYVVPRPGGRVLAGATVEHVGFRKEVTAGAVAGLIDSAIRLVPALSRAGFVRAWSGLRPGTPDGLPILGATPVAGLFVATGHFRNGILLAPATARGMADLLSGTAVASFAPFSLSRFSASSSSTATPAAPASGVFG